MCHHVLSVCQRLRTPSLLVCHRYTYRCVNGIATSVSEVTECYQCVSVSEVMCTHVRHLAHAFLIGMKGRKDR